MEQRQWQSSTIRTQEKRDLQGIFEKVDKFVTFCASLKEHSIPNQIYSLKGLLPNPKDCLMNMDEEIRFFYRTTDDGRGITEIHFPIYNFYTNKRIYSGTTGYTDNNGNPSARDIFDISWYGLNDFLKYRDDDYVNRFFHFVDSLQPYEIAQERIETDYLFRKKFKGCVRSEIGTFAAPTDYIIDPLISQYPIFAYGGGYYGIIEDLDESGYPKNVHINTKMGAVIEHTGPFDGYNGSTKFI